MKLSNLNNITVYLFSLAISGLISSCGGANKNESASSAEFEKAESEIKSKVENIIYQIPPPSEIPFIIQATGAKFNPDLVNPLGNAERYKTTNKVAALNLGIYTTDIGYLVTYDKVQEALNYMDVCLGLVEAIGIQNVIDQNLIQKFENNLGEKDTLASIVNYVISRSDQYLKESDRNNIAALVLTGTFIEGLFIATQIVETYPKDILPEDSRNLILSPMIKLILQQEKPLTDIIELLKSIDLKGDWIEGMINSLEELKDNYAQLNIDEQINNNRSDLVLTNKVLQRITVQIDKIRTTVTY